MACFGPFQYVIGGIYGFINVKVVLNKATDAKFRVNLLLRLTKTLIGHFEPMILSFQILFSILRALI